MVITVIQRYGREKPVGESDVKDRMLAMFLNDSASYSAQLHYGFALVRPVGDMKEGSTVEIVPVHPFSALQWVETMVENVDKIVGPHVWPDEFVDRIEGTIKLLQSLKFDADGRRQRIAAPSLPNNTPIGA